MKRWTVALIVLLLMMANTDLFAQCAMCRGTVESTVSNGRSVVASQLNIGIIYLLAAPYLLVTAVAYMWYRNSKREHGKRIEIAGRIKRVMSSM
ncbi:hypothetical protein [Spirosoma rhododendri]|uniref:Uncharacterized protein n=1 Tax=Spirosoma rhododendri TaxID=2728024 RepID=A0A7L5DNS2_9BACT|nr:hypothetical protein [Spirosoma rhododendri]QJD78128.1 hypothetical protein HH216_06605 [Spirosoma rhododendri]